MYIEDDAENRSDLIEALSGEEINGQTIEIEGEETFEVGISRIRDFHIVILDLYNKAHSSLGSSNVLTERIFKAVSSNSNSVTTASPP